MDEARAVLKQVWGYDAFRPGQDEVVEACLAGRDVLAVLPTGGGKSICYQVPALLRDGLTIVVSPLIALMLDQVAGLRARGVAATFINSTLSHREVEQRWTDAEFGRYRILYLAPERLSSEAFRLRAPRLDITCVAVDEAHCISEWGHHFRPEYRQIADALEVVARPQVVAVTATATPQVRADIADQLRLKEPSVTVRGFDRPNIVWSVFQTSDRRGQVKRVLEGVPGSGILYAATRRTVEDWASWLEGEGVAAAAYHGGMSSDLRERVQGKWISGDIRVITATNAFGMGIDKPDVRFVVHDGIPASLEAYYQEAGRAGRDGARSYAVLLYQQPDRQVQQALIDSAHPSRDQIRTVYDTVTSLAQVAVGSHPEDPLVVDIRQVQQVTGLPDSLIGTSVDFLERQGIWSNLYASEHRGYIRFTTGPEAVRTYARNQRPRLAEFIEGILRAVDASAYSTWYPLDLRVVARRLSMDRQRVSKGLRFLAEHGYLRWCAPGASLLLQMQEPRVARVQVDVEALKRSRRNAEHKLDEMVQYAETHVCRRRYLLDYFGENAAPQCGQCDVCLGRHEVEPVSPTDEAALRKLLEAIYSGRRPRQLVSAGVMREEDLVRLLDWLERERMIDEAPLADNGYTVTADGLAWLA